MVALAAAAIGAGVAWRYRSLGKSLIMRGTGLGGVVLGFATSPAGRKVASLLMERWEAARQSADKVVDTAVDTALEDSFPASDPPALTARLTPR